MIAVSILPLVELHVILTQHQSVRLTLSKPDPQAATVVPIAESGLESYSYSPGRDVPSLPYSYTAVPVTCRWYRSWPFLYSTDGF